MLGFRRLTNQVVRTASAHYGATMQALWSALLPPSAMQPALAGDLQQWQLEEEKEEKESLFDGIIYFAVPKKKVRFIFVLFCFVFVF